MKESFFISNWNPIFECREQMTLLDNFFFPQISCNWVQVFKDFILTVFDKDSDSIFPNLIHNNLGAVDFFRCVFQSLIEVIRTDISHNKGFIIFEDSKFLELTFQLFWSFYIKTDYTYTNVGGKCVRWELIILFQNLF